MLGRSALVQSALAVTMLLVSTRVARAGETIEGCCLADGSCANLANADCLQQSGIPQPGVTCNGASCGACCSVDAMQPGLACTLALASNCTAAQQRAFAGPGTDCDNGCPFCCTCTGGQDCSNACTDDMPDCGICPPGCLVSVSLFDDCQDGCETTGCCEVGRDDSNRCADTNAAACALFGTFHPGQTCNAETGTCTPRFCCRCEGDPSKCGDGGCTDRCLGAVCESAGCTAIVTSGTCDDGCKPTGCCSAARGMICGETDAAACEFLGGTFVLGGTCNPTSGECLSGPSPTPTVTPTVTVTTTASKTATASATAAPTSTRVPEGGSCTDTSQCAPLLVCVDSICTAVNAPAPTTSRLGLVVVLAALLAIAAVSLRRLVASRR